MCRRGYNGFLNQISFKYYENLGIYYILYYLDIHQKELKSIQPLFLDPGTQLLFVGRSKVYLHHHHCSKEDCNLLLHLLLHLNSHPMHGLTSNFKKKLKTLSSTFSFPWTPKPLHPLPCPYQYIPTLTGLPCQLQPNFIT